MYNMDTLSKDVVKKIKRTIAANNTKDLKEFGIKGTLTYEDFINKIKEQGNKCYVCLQDFQYNGKQWCYFFPSPDRIYNFSHHSKENVGASCLFCNIRMFKQISLKVCGLCEGLNHVYTEEIITKSTLFYNLGNDNDIIKDYINSINKSNIANIEIPV